MTDERVRPLLRVRQIREFSDEPVDHAHLDAIADVARWSGSSRNSQPWRFIVIRDVDTIRRIAKAGHPQTRSMRTAKAAIAIVIPAPGDDVSHSYDEGRAAERILIAASVLGLGAGVAWVFPKVLPAVRDILGLPDDRMVRTIVAIGHPSEAAWAPKSAPGEARLPRAEVVFEDHWPSDQTGGSSDS